MPFVQTLNPAVPADGGNVSAGAGNIRNLTAALIERLNSFFVDANTSPLTGKAGASMAATTFTGSGTFATGLTVTAGGITVQAGTSAFQAVTATTLQTSSIAGFGTAPVTNNTVAIQGATNDNTSNILLGKDSGGTTRFFLDSTGAFSGKSMAVTAGIDLTGAPPVAPAGHVALGGTTRTTIGANGAATALTALPLGYLDINVGGTTAQIPYYNRGA